MNKTLYLECGSGISGDMTVAALLDLGADETVLRNALESLNLEGYQIAVTRVKKSGIDACDFAVLLDEIHENHDHDMAYLHGRKEGSEHVQTHENHFHEEHTPENHSHEGHAHENHSHKGHIHRTLKEIEAIISGGNLTERANQLAIRIFTILAEAEAKAHGLSVSEVHFHEVGAVDSIVDIVAVSVCIDNLGITDVVVQKLYEGRGCIHCQHGVIPVPVPAVVNIAEAYELPLHIVEEEGEFVTPTGAAIAAALRTSSRLPEQFRILCTGIGAGKRKYSRPSILRAMLIEDQTNEQRKDAIYKLETNIDDCTGENLGYVMERLFEAGARDVHYLPVYMKKNRPAYQLNVICCKEDISKMEEIIFQNTTTIGVRRIQMERTILEREIRTVHTSLGEVSVKICSLGGTRRIYPEYESVAMACRESGMSYTEAYARIAEECWSILGEME